MTRNELFDFAKQKGHQVIFTELQANDAISIELHGLCYIALSTEDSEIEELENLAHELGHCEYAGFYSILTPMNTRERIEYRAKKWQYHKLIPLGQLRQAIRNGLTAPWELADYFNVSEDTVFKACEYYTNACGAILDSEAM
ncbi:ImmA/IrrE family metallo-endopeptidase [Intestinibacillus massiliensis]|uniref:ImmA/IrrE family metallo-endopeptidase n=1 Tax=Intestinibacillus massiliensis TaxID=1871029 RepID=UPI000B35A4DF|nr:ImmA/IrrE family metallo-endopeptidase [Intestinibacillus massiliensis]